MADPEIPQVHLPARLPFLQAKHFLRPAAPRQVDLLVIHSAEIGETLAGAEDLMIQCAQGVKHRKGEDLVEVKSSWHKAFDADSVTQSVLETDVAYHAPGVNAISLGYELSGRARQSPEEWMDDFSIKTLELAAWQAAKDLARFQIPAVFQDAGGLLAGRRGVTTHAEVSKAFKRSTHWDPGPFFPMAHFLNRITWWYTARPSHPAMGKTETNA